MFPWDKPGGGPRQAFKGNPHSSVGVQYRLGQNREREEQITRLEKYVGQGAMMKRQNESAVRTKNMRHRGNVFAQSAQRSLEAQANEMNVKQKISRTQKQDQMLAMEMARRAKAEEQRKREVQRICEADPELRELQSKLKAAYMNQERAAQLQESTQLKKAAQAREREFFLQQERQRAEQDERDRQKQEQNARQRAAKKTQIEQQKRDQKRREEEHAYEEFVRDRKQVENLLSDIKRKEIEAAREKERKRKGTYDNMVEGLKLRQEGIEMKKRAEAAQATADREYSQLKDQRKEKAMAKAAQQELTKAAIYSRLTSEAAAKAAEEERVDSAIELLRKEEAENRRDKAERDRREKEMRSKLEMMRANEAQKQFKREQRQREMAHEKQLVARMRDKFAQDEERERQENMAREAAKGQYMSGIKAQMDQRRQMYQYASSADQVDRAKKEAAEAYRKQVVEEARQQLLAQHASKLKGFLPKGVLKNKGDLELMSLFDADGDGNLSQAEVANAQKMLMQYGDADGDGQLTEQEREAGFAQFRQRAAQFDADGDGKYNKDEAKAMWG